MYHLGTHPDHRLGTVPREPSMTTTDPRPAMTPAFATRIGAWFGGLFLAAIGILFFLWYLGLPQVGLQGASRRWLAEAGRLLEHAADHHSAELLERIETRRGNILYATESRTISHQLGQDDAPLQASLGLIFERLQRTYPQCFDSWTLVYALNKAAALATLQGDANRLAVAVLLLTLVETQTRLEQALAGMAKSEARYRTMFEQSPLGVALIDSLTGQIDEVNPRFAAIAGRTRAQMAGIDCRPAQAEGRPPRTCPPSRGSIPPGLPCSPGAMEATF
jgi:PAS domain-containing protein